MLPSAPGRIPIRRVILSRLGRRLSAFLPVALAADLLLPIAREAQAHAYADGSIAFGENPAVAQNKDGVVHATVNFGATDAFSGASGDVYADSEFTRYAAGASNQYRPFLHASASGQAVQNGDFGAQSVASAGWSDNLRYSNTQIVDPVFLSLSTSIYFVGHFDGTVSGLASGHTGGSFLVDVSRLVGDNVVSYQQEFTFDHSGSYNQEFRLKLPANFLIPGTDTNGERIYAQLSLSLTVAGGSQYDGSGNFQGDSSSRFNNTAALDTIYIGDDAGNPLPQYADIQVVGDQGAYVMGAPAPEPGTWVLVGIAAGMGFLTLRRQRGRA